MISFHHCKEEELESEMNIPSTPSSTSAGNNTPTCSESNLINNSNSNGLSSNSNGNNNCGSSTPSSSGDNDHLQRLAQMAQGVGVGMKDSATAVTTDPSLYQSAAAAAYVHQYGNWQNAYYQQFSQPMNPAAAAAFPGWPGNCYGGAPHWSSYAQTKKGRQTYQRYQTSVLESKFQQSSYVSKKQREELRLQTNLTDRQIKIWFQNRRMKAKKEKTRVDDGSGDHGSLLPANPPKQINHLNHMAGGNSLQGGQAGQQLMHMNTHSQRQDSLSDAAAAAAAAGFSLMNPWGSSMNNTLMGTNADPNSMIGGQAHHMTMGYPGNSGAAAYGMQPYPGALCPPNV
uniref:Homeobox domain-containing protein n=1 Tax=Strongyloides papillosus TaxID=174720 RepID=A0A0N5BM47_STREA